MNFFNRSFNNRSSQPPAHSSTSYAYRELESTPRSNTSVMYTRDWRSALRTPPPYRIGNRTLRFNYHFALLVVCVCTLFFLFFYIRTGSTSSSDTAWLKSYSSSPNSHSSSAPNPPRSLSNEVSPYKGKYPLTKAIVKGREIIFRIAMVADLDVNSKVVKDDGSIVWRSYLKKGNVGYNPAANEIRITWDTAEPTTLESGFSMNGRGMELSELVTFDERLLTFDDRTGIVYELVNETPVPWIILMDGDGHTAKGFKAEWATVKDEKLYVGSMGKEWTTGTGKYRNDNPMFVKEITPDGMVRSLNWTFNYKVLRQDSLGIQWPGYMIHESGVWSSVHQKWFFLPRRCSKEKYNETRDEYMGCNVLITADSKFRKIETVTLDKTKVTPTHGFSSFKFLPEGNDNFIVALKSEEVDGKTFTYITAFDIKGKPIMEEQKVDTLYKYEGIEFI